MQVIVMYIEPYGFVGVANDYYNAVKWLIDQNWIYENTEFYNVRYDDQKGFATIKEYFGSDWANKMFKEWDIETFNEILSDVALLEVATLIGTEEENR